MENGIFPQITELIVPQWRASYEKKCIFHEMILHRYLTKKIDGWSVGDFLDTEEIGYFALYAVTDFTELFIKDLEKCKNGSSRLVICDKNPKNFPKGFAGRSVIFPDEMVCRYKSGSVKKIIVMSVLHENEIIDELLKKGIRLNDLISFVSILYL